MTSIHHNYSFIHSIAVHKRCDGSSTILYGKRFLRIVFRSYIKVLFRAQVDFIGQRVTESDVYYNREWRRFNGFPERPLFADRTSRRVRYSIYAKHPPRWSITH